MKNIGLVVYDISLTGGAENVALNMAAELSKNHRVHMISLFDQKGFEKECRPYTVHILNEKTVSIPVHFFFLCRKLRKILKEQQIDVLFSITAGVITVATCAARGLKAKVVYCEHSNLENKTYGKKHMLRQYIGAKFSDCIVALTDRDRLNFIKNYGLNQEQVLSIPNWFVYDEGVEACYDPKSKRIISAGRLEYVKGYDLLIQAAAKVYEKHPDWHWDIYGEGTMRPQIDQWVKENALQDFITLKGNVKDIAQRYKDYAMFVMTSYYEGLPLVLLEAQVARLPIVSFDCPTGPAEIIEDGENGYLVPPYNIDLLAQKIEALIQDEEKRMVFSSKSTRNLQNFSKKSVLEKWEALIDTLS